jgi:hypothetical protein
MGLRGSAVVDETRRRAGLLRSFEMKGGWAVFSLRACLGRWLFFASACACGGWVFGSVDVPSPAELLV